MGTRFRIEPAEKRVTMKFLIVLACFLAVGCAEDAAVAKSQVYMGVQKPSSYGGAGYQSTYGTQAYGNGDYHTKPYQQEHYGTTSSQSQSYGGADYNSYGQSAYSTTPSYNKY